MAGQFAINLAAEAICARLRVLTHRARLGDVAGLCSMFETFSAELALFEAAAAPAGPETVWIVYGRDPDDSRVGLVAVELTEEAARDAERRVRASERPTDYPHHLGICKVRVGVNYLYELDGAPPVNFF